MGKKRTLNIRKRALNIRRGGCVRTPRTPSDTPLLIVMKLFSAQNIFFEWSKWCMELWWLRQNQTIWLSDTWCSRWVFKEDFMVKNSQIKQQPYRSSGFVFKCKQRAGFLSKSVKDRLWIWKLWYCYGTLFVDRD